MIDWTEFWEALILISHFNTSVVSLVKCRCHIQQSILGSLKRKALQWRHNGRNSVSNHQPHDCLLNRLFRRRSKKTSKLRVTGLCAGTSPGTGEFPAQMASYTEKSFHLMTSSWNIQRKNFFQLPPPQKSPWSVWTHITFTHGHFQHDWRKMYLWHLLV